MIAVQAERPRVAASRLRLALRPLGVYLLAAIVYTWPLALSPASVLAADQGPGDPYLNLWILGWNLQTISERPAALLDGRVFDAPIFHPAPGTLAYSDHQIPQAVAVWPLYRLTGDLVLTYNVLFFASIVACGLAMYLFAWSVTGSRAGAYLAGLAWAAWPFHFAHLLHLQLQALYWLPLGFYFLHRLAAGLRRWHAMALGVVAALQGAASLYYGVIGAIALATGAVVLVAMVGRPRRGVLIRRLLTSAAVGVLVIAPFVWPYWQAQREEGFTRNLAEAARHAATPTSYLNVPPSNAYAIAGLLPSEAGPERQLFPGFVILALGLVGASGAFRGDARALGMSMTAVVVMGFVLSLGPDGIRPLYSTLHRTLFGFQAVRAPARFGVLVAFGLAVLAALGLREVMIRRSGGKATLLASVFVLGAGVEYLNAPVPYVARPSTHTAVGAWLEAAPGTGAVVHLPLGLDIENTVPMLQGLEHRRPLVNGYSGQRPPFYAALAETLSTFPSAEAIWALHDIGVQYIVTRVAVAVGEWPLAERATLGGADGGAAHVYELVWSPEVEARLALPDAPAPPPAGSVPFVEEEEAVYDVRWLGAGRGVPAGRAVIGARRVEGETPGFQFVVTARTAEWVSRFFEAHDRFETTVDTRLLPLVHAQQLREGRRSVDRRATYDHDRQLVAVGRSAGGESPTEPALTLRIWPETRDPIAAFFYIRSLDLQPGESVRLPVNDLGRNLVMDVRAGEVESIVHGGRQIDALRLEPSLTQRIARRRPLDIRVWVSADDRRVPLVVEIEAGFGAVRADLVGYRAR